MTDAPDPPSSNPAPETPPPEDPPPGTPRLLPGFLLHGDAALGFPRREGTARLRAMIGTAQPQVPEAWRGERHDPRSAGDAAVVDWLRHLAAGRLGSP